MSKKFGSTPYHGVLDAEDWFSDAGSVTGKASKAWTPCYASHPQVPLGGGVFIGGSCGTPVVATADVYLGFDRAMSVRPGLPWESQPVQALYLIPDMGVPKNPETFVQLVMWTALRLKDGQTVHAGCIGGHGRTGMFLAALWKEITGEKDAIRAVRKVYCHKAVESDEQVQFLSKHFGISKADGAKKPVLTYSVPAVSYPAYSGGKELKSLALVPSQGAEVLTPLKNSPLCMWGTVF